MMTKKIRVDFRDFCSSFNHIFHWPVKWSPCPALRSDLTGAGLSRPGHPLTPDQVRPPGPGSGSAIGCVVTSQQPVRRQTPSGPHEAASDHCIIRADNIPRYQENKCHWLRPSDSSLEGLHSKQTNWGKFSHRKIVFLWRLSSQTIGWLFSFVRVEVMTVWRQVLFGPL